MKHFDYEVSVPATHPDTGEKTYPMNHPQGGQTYFETRKGSGTLAEIESRLKESGHKHELNDWPEGKELASGDEVATIVDSDGQVRGTITFAGETE